MEAKQIYGMRFSDEEIANYGNAMFRAVDFIQTFFYQPWDKRKLMKLTPFQVDMIDCVQFGFPITKFKFEEVPNPPKGVVILAPRQRGKSMGVSAGAAALTLMNPYFGNGMIGAQEETSYRLLRKARWFIENSIFKDEIVKHKMDYLELNNEAFIQSHPCSEKSIIGSTYKYLFADEVKAMDETVLFESALPTVIHGDRWVMITTPKGSKKKFMEYYYKGLETRPIICTSCGERYTQKDFNAPSFPISSMPIGLHECIECGGSSYKYGVGQIAVPYVDPWNDPIIDQANLRATLDLHEWSPTARQEYLAEIIDEASMVFLDKRIKMALSLGEEHRIRNAMPRKLDKNVFRSLGVDYGRKHDASCFCVTHVDKPNNRVVLDYMTSIAGEFDEEREYSEIQDELTRVAKHFKPQVTVVDATGLGDPLLEQLENDFKQKKIRTKILNYPKNTKGFVISRKTKVELIGETIKRFSTNPIQVEIPPLTEPEMDDFVKELMRFECEVSPTYVKYGTQSYHDDRVIAFALSVWGHRSPMWYKPEIRMFNYSKMFDIDANFEY